MPRRWCSRRPTPWSFEAEGTEAVWALARAAEHYDRLMREEAEEDAARPARVEALRSAWEEGP